MRGALLDPSSRPGSVWWTPLELARRWAAMSMQAAVEAIGNIARAGDRLAAIERPDSDVAQVIAEQLAEEEGQQAERLAGWLLKGSRIDVDA